jgi:hypothetical protein
MEPIQPLLASTIAALVRPAPMSAEKLNFVWRAAVGPAVARATSVRITSERVLEVLPEDDRWSDEVERSADVVLARVRDLLGADAVERMVVRRKAPKTPRSRRYWTRTGTPPPGEGEHS